MVKLAQWFTQRLRNARLRIGPLLLVLAVLPTLIVVVAAVASAYLAHEQPAGAGGLVAAGGGLAVTGTVVVGGILSYRYLITRLKDVAAFSERISGGDLSARIRRIPLATELQQVSVLLNQMAESLESRTCQLQEAEAKYRTLVEEIPAATYISALDAGVTTTYVSPQIEQLTGYRPEELIGDISLWLTRTHADDRAAILEQFTAGVARTSQVHCEYRMIAPDGRVVWLEDRANVVHASDGRPLYLQGVIVDVTQFKKLEVSLRQSEASLRALLNASDDAAFLTDAQGVFLETNQVTAGRLGMTAQELRGRTVTDVLPADVAESRMLYIRQVVASGRPAMFEDMRDGLRIENSIHPVLDDQGRVVRLAIYGRDITGRRAAELEREKLYQQIYRAKREWEVTVDSLPQIVCVLDRAGQVMRVSRAIEKWNLGTVSEALGANLHKLLHPDCHQSNCYLQQLWFDAVQRVSANLPVAREVYDGQLNRHLRIEAQPFLSLRDEMGDTSGFVVLIIHDVSDRKQVEQDLHESEEKFRALVERTPDMIVRYDKTGRCLYANPEFEHLTGQSGGSIAGRFLDELGLPGEATEQWTHAIQQVVRSGREVQIECAVGTGDGVKYLQTRMVPESTTDSGVESLIAVSRDVTALKRSQESLARYAARLEIVRRIYQSILTAQSVENIAAAALNHMWQIVRCQWADVILLDAESQLWRVVAEWPRGRTPFAVGATYPLSALAGDTTALNAGAEPVRLTLVQAGGGARRVEWEGRTLMVPLIARGELIGLLNLAGIGPDAIPEEIAGIAREVGDHLALALADARLHQSVNEQREQLQTLAARTAEMQEAEQRRLAGELHDRVGQNLTALGINLNIVRSQLPDTLAASMASRLDATMMLLEETVDHVRDVMAELRPPVLDDYGLLAALRWYVQRFAYFTGTATLVEGEEMSPRLSQMKEIALFRIAQEGLTNVAKHAEARQVIVRLTHDDAWARLSIADNGHGFDVLSARRSGSRSGWGLITMQERATAVGGRLKVESTPGTGTEIVIEVPR